MKQDPPPKMQVEARREDPRGEASSTRQGTRKDQSEDRDGPGLEPYCGEQIERLRHLGHSRSLSRFAADDGGRTYRFNRLGFRGPEPDEEAERRVYVFGESHAFGYFVELEQSWPWRFTERWCGHHGLPRSTVELLNFADPGASNASIARQVISQCSARPPDLALVHFADIRRSEVILDDRPHRIGPWLLEAAARQQARQAPGDLPATLHELIERGKAYFRSTLGPKTAWAEPVPDATCLLEALREVLLVQYFCQAQGIRLVATLDRMEDLRAMAPQDHPVLAPLVAALDETILCPFGIWSVMEESILGGGDDSVSSDPGHADPGHASPERHAHFADAVFEFYRQARDSQCAVTGEATSLDS